MFLALPVDGAGRMTACALVAVIALGLAGDSGSAAAALRPLQREPIGVLVTSATFENPAKQEAVSDSAIDLMRALGDNDIDTLTAVMRIEDADMFVRVLDRFHLRVVRTDPLTGALECCDFVAYNVTVGDDAFVVFGADGLAWRNAALDGARRIKRWADVHYYRIKGLPLPEAATPGGIPPDVLELRDMLDDQPVERRVAAALALGDLGERAVGAERQLVNRLFADDPVYLFDHPQYPYARFTNLGVESARALAQAGLMEPLLEGLRGSGRVTAYNVALGLANSTHPDTEALLIEAATSDNARARQAAVSGLGFVPRFVWKRLLQPDVRDPGVRPQDPRAIDTLIAALDDGSTRVREAAAEALAYRPALRAMEPLISALDDRPSVRRVAAASLRRLTGADLDDDEDDWRAWWAQNEATFRPDWAAEPAAEPPPGGAGNEMSVVSALEAALEINRQRLTMAHMLAIATANGMARVYDGAYADELASLQARGYATSDALTDGWDNPFVYTREDDGYTLISYGCDAAPGPAPPAAWNDLPCAPDIILRDGAFVQAPGMR